VFRGVESVTADSVRDELRGIGDMSRETGLTISEMPARLLAGLRRVGMALVEIGRVLVALPDTGAAQRLSMPTCAAWRTVSPTPAANFPASIN
jgi:hypothetical protein